MTPTTARTRLPPLRFEAGQMEDSGPALRQAFRRDGYLVIENFLPLADCEALRQRAAELVAGFNPAEALTVFSTGSQSHARDAYFLESGDCIRFFAEEGAVDAAGRLTVEKEQALNKIGHALHDCDPVFDNISRAQPFAILAGILGMGDPLLLQSMYIFKQPRIGGEVGWHQDASFLYTEPLTTVGFWLAVDDAMPENGCMTALVGGHRGQLRQRFLRDGLSTRMVGLDDTPWPDVGAVTLDVPAGSLVVLHSLLPHASGRNHSDRARHAYALHLIDGMAGYAADNWLQRPSLPLRGFT